MKALGIIGGMGPLATADLFTKIVESTAAASDGEHIHVLIDSDPAIPDRTDAILHGGASPLPAILRTARNLEAMGAELLLMPCNTAHHFIGGLRAGVGVPVMSMIEETAAAVAKAGIGIVGLLATDGTVRSAVYDGPFAEAGVRLVCPAPRMQSRIMDLIYNGVKAGRRQMDTAPFLEVLAALERQGAETMILGCTELPIAFSRYGITAAAVDPTLTLAKAAVRAAGKSVKMAEI